MLRHVYVPTYGVFKAPSFPVDVPQENGLIERKMVESNKPLPDSSTTNLKSLLNAKIPLDRVNTKIVGGDVLPFLDALEDMPAGEVDTIPQQA